MKLELRWKLIGSLLLLMIVIGIQGAVAYRAMTDNQASSAFVQHTYQVIDLSASTLQALSNMEAGYRDFLETGREQALQPYSDGQQAFINQVTELRRLSADNPGQVVRWQTLQQRVADWQQSVTEPGITLRRASPAGNASGELLALLGSDQDSQAFASLRSMFNAAQFVERQLLAQSLQDQAANAQMLNITLLGGIPLDLVLAALIAFLLHRDLITDEVARRRMSAILESITDAFVATDRHGRFTYVNSKAELILGRTHKELIGQPNGAVLPEWAGSRIFRDPQQLSAAQPSVTYEYLDHDGRWLEVHVYSGEEGLTAYLHDVTDRKRAEDEVRALNVGLEQRVAARTAELERVNSELERASQIKSEFLANMSHELRTPLNGIIGFSELMYDGKLGPIGDDHREYLGYILSSSRHLLQLINDVLDLSKVEAGKMEFHPEPLRLPAVVDGVLDTVRSIAVEKDITVETSFDEGIGDVVLDEGKLKQVLYNFVSNALKFTPDHGQVAVRVTAESAETFRLAVHDSGIGIKPEDVERLFVKFSQLDGASDKRYQGTGLGLALTKRIAQAQGGRVGVESIVGEGSTFFAVLPRLSPGAPKVALQAASMSVRKPGSSRVLVVEDRDDDRAWLLATLSDAGYEVHSAASGAEAVALSRELRFDAITLDLLLPDMHGWEVLGSIRASALNNDAPVIVITVLADRTAAAGFAIQDFLPKPARAEDVLGALERAGVHPDNERAILVVDDDLTALKLMETTLKQLGYASHCVADSEEGLRLASAEHPAAVVLDLLMPGIDGFEFLDRLRRTTNGQSIPVLVWTNKDLTSQDEARLRMLAQAVVSKSSAGTTLLEALELLLTERTPLPA